MRYWERPWRADPGEARVVNRPAESLASDTIPCAENLPPHGESLIDDRMQMTVGGHSTGFLERMREGWGWSALLYFCGSHGEPGYSRWVWGGVDD